MLKRRPPAGNIRRVAPIELNLRGVMTNKAGRLVQYESFAELLLTLMLDRDAMVVDYGSQPETFNFYDEEARKNRTYTPDFIVWKKDGLVEIHEVTRSERQGNSNIKQREIAAQKICQERGWKYIVHNEKTLPEGARKANLLILFSFRPIIYYNAEVDRAIFEALQEEPQILILSLATKISTNLGLAVGDVTATIYHLILLGHLKADLDSLLLHDGVPSQSAFVWRS